LVSTVTQSNDTTTANTERMMKKRNTRSELPILAKLATPKLVLGADVVLCCAILYMMPYTEIDWIAYMQEVKGYLDGELDYTRIQGDTGPLVYPGGFVYLYSAFYYLTNNGANVFLAQLVFAALYLSTTAVVLHLYGISRVPFVYSIALLASRRMHSIFLLRLFNDGIAMLFAYAAIYWTVWRQWALGALLYSVAVSVKMNVFLMAPGLLALWLQHLGILRTVMCLTICAMVQLMLGWPFLVAYPVQYLSKAFELSRVFTYKWTVNYKFLDEATFESPMFGAALLSLTLLSWAWLWITRWSKRRNGSVRGIIQTVMESNMIGVIFARTLHYQFYSWFFHCVPLLLALSCRRLHWMVQLLVWGCMEYGFTVYPSTALSSGVLMGSFGVMWLGMMFSGDVVEEEEELCVKQ
jgi:alpha-1,3-mannosyltransferase